MHSNFITPPDIIQTILIVDATADQIEAVADKCRDAETSYNIYMYRADMNELNWLVDVSKKADVILKQEDSEVPVLDYIKFGEKQNFIKNPVDYFK